MTGQVVERETVPGRAGQHRIKLKVGNRDLYGADFLWVDEASIARREYPADVAVIERTEWGAPHRDAQGGADDGDRWWRRARGAGRARESGCPRPARVRAADPRAIEKGDIGADQPRAGEDPPRACGGSSEGRHRRGPRWTPSRRELAPLQARLPGARRSARAPARVGAVERGGGGRPGARRRSCRSPRWSTSTSRTRWARSPSPRTTRAQVWEFVADEPARVQHRGRRVPRHLRHRDDGGDHEHPGDAARRARRLLPARVREAGPLRERGAHRGQQPGRRAVHRVRRVRRRVLHLLRGRHHRPPVLSPSRCPRRPTARAASCGPR